MCMSHVVTQVRVVYTLSSTIHPHCPSPSSIIYTVNMASVPTIDPHRYSKNPGGKFVSDEVALFFENAGFMTPPENNKRRVSAAFLSGQTYPSVPVSPSSSEAISPASFPASSTNAPQSEIEVPEYLNSIRTYELIGFNHDVAYDMWSRYITGYPDDPEGDFMDYARAQIKYTHPVPHGLSTSEDWDEIMTRLGINSTLRAAILSPGFDDIRGTASCKHWVSQATEMRFEALNQLMVYLSDEYERRKKQAENCEDDDASSSAAPNTTTEEAPASLDGHTMLWHACSKPAADFCTSSWCLQLGKLDAHPGDFGGCRTYFTPQWQTANRFAMYFKHIAPLAEMALLQIAVPNAFLASLSKCTLSSEGDSSETWKKLVWSSRGCRSLGGEDLMDLCERDLSVAHILVSANARFDEVNGYAALQSSDALMVEVDGEWEKAEQWSFSQWGPENDFAELCKGKCWVHAVGRLVRTST